MKKIKRIFGIALTMLLMAAFPSRAAATTTYTHVISFSTSSFDYSANWGTVYCYIWDELNNTTTNYVGAFPGTAMTYDSNTSKWTYTLTTTTAASDLKVIFSNGSNGVGSNQTNDLSLSSYATTTSVDDTEENPSGDTTTTTTTTSAAGNLYLVGNFLATDTENSAFAYSFRLSKKTDEDYYSIYIPATLSGVTFNLQMSDGSGNYTVYGCSNNSSTYNFNASWPSAGGTVPSTAADITENGDSWCLNVAHANSSSDDGTYEFKVWLNSSGVPSTWQMTHITNLRVAYFVQSPHDVTNPVMQVATMYGNSGTYDNKYHGYIYLPAGNRAYVVSNVKYNTYDSNNQVLTTTDKLYSQSNQSGNNPASGGDQNTKVAPVYGYGGTSDTEGFKFSDTANSGIVLEYNPNKGNGDMATASAAYVSGEVYKTEGIEIANLTINTLSVIGDITGGWTSSGENSTSNNEKAMTYDEDEGCYTITLTTTADEGTQEFRFIANGSWANSWQEDGTAAKVPYDTGTTGHAATEAEPNYVSYLSSSSTTHEAVGGTDIIFNRPAGVWTIKFYIDVETTGSTTTVTYRYTITGEEGITISPMYCSATKEFVCTYSNKEATNLQSGVKAYVAYSYEGSASQGSTNSTPEGTLYMRQMDYVPANVGVVLIVDASVTSETDLTNGQSYSFPVLLTKRSEASATSETEYPTAWTKYGTSGYETWHNFLRPNTTGSVMTVGNADYDSSDNIIERRFGLSLYSKTTTGQADSDYTDYYGFFRFTSAGKIADGRAYLYLPVEDGGYGNLTYSGQILSNLTQTDEEAVESKGIGHMVFDDMEGYDETEPSSTTGITTIQESEVRTSDNAYYTLQGIRIATPTRGIYIHNGKKVVIR